MSEELGFWKVVKSWGFLFMVGVALVLTWIADLSGQFNVAEDVVKVRLLDFLYNLILAIVYVLIRLNPKMDLSPFNKKPK